MWWRRCSWWWRSFRCGWRNGSAGSPRPAGCRGRSVCSEVNFAPSVRLTGAVNITLLVRFVAVAEELHFPRAAKKLNIPLASLYSSISKLEDEVGAPLFVRNAAETRLTQAGVLFLATARNEIAAAPAPAPKPVVPAG